MKRFGMRHALALAVLSLACCGLGPCQLGSRGKSAVPDAGALYHPKRETISKSVFITGRVETAEKVVVTAPLGNKIKNLHVSVGQKVKAAAPLIEYDETAILSEVTQLRNALASKASEVRNLKLSLEGLKKKKFRAEVFYQKKIGAARDLEDAERELNIATNTLAVRELEIRTERNVLLKTEENLKNLVVRSPIEGTITFLWLGGDTFAPGTSVKEGERLVVVSGGKSLVIDGKIPEADISLVSEQSKAEVTLDAMRGRKFAGSIVKIAPTPEVDPSSGISSFPVRVALKEHDPAIRPGMSAECAIIVENREKALAIPLSAVLSDGRADYVEVVKDGVTEKRAVTVGLTNDFTAEITQGLTESDLVKVP